MYRGVTGERRAWVDEVRSFVYIDNPGGSGTWYSWDADARMSAERYTDRIHQKHIDIENRHEKPDIITRHIVAPHSFKFLFFEKSRSRPVLQTHDRRAATTKTPRPGNHPRADPMEPRNTQSRRVTKNLRNRRFYSPQKPEKLLFDNLFA